MVVNRSDTAIERIRVFFAGSDIGGFIDHPNPELYTRWMQTAVFHPFAEHTVAETMEIRNHGHSEKIL